MYPKDSGPIPELFDRVSTITVSVKEINERSAIVSVPAALQELQSVVDDGLIVGQLATVDPVPGMEACKVRADVANLFVRIVVGQIRPVANSRLL